MAKRDAQTFEWKSEFDGTLYVGLTIVGRKDGPQQGKRLEFDIGDYPHAVREKILAAGHKAVFQQRTSQCNTDAERLEYWPALHDLLASGEFEREGGARGAPVVAAWVEAASAAKGCTTGEFQASLNKLAKEVRAKVKANCEAKFAKEIEAIKARRAEGDVDLADLQ